MHSNVPGYQEFNEPTLSRLCAIWKRYEENSQNGRWRQLPFPMPVLMHSCRIVINQLISSHRRIVTRTIRTSIRASTTITFTIGAHMSRIKNLCFITIKQCRGTQMNHTLKINVFLHRALRRNYHKTHSKVSNAL